MALTFLIKLFNTKIVPNYENTLVPLLDSAKTVTKFFKRLNNYRLMPYCRIFKHPYVKNNVVCNFVLVSFPFYCPCP